MSEWLATLPEDLQGNDTLKQYKSVEEAARGLIETKSMVGRSLGRIPGEDASPEQRADWAKTVVEKAPELMLRPDFADTEQADEFYTILGRPDAPDKYENPEDFAGLPEAVEKDLRETAHKLNLTKKQYQDLAVYLATQAEEMQSTQAAARETGEGALKAEWGLAYDQRIGIIGKVIEQFFGEDVPVDNLPPSWKKGLYKVAESLMGKKEVAFQVAEGEPELDVSELKAQIAEIDANPAYWGGGENVTREQQKGLQDKRLKLQQKLSKATRR